MMEVFKWCNGEQRQYISIYEIWLKTNASNRADRIVECNTSRVQQQQQQLECFNIYMRVYNIHIHIHIYI